MTSIGSLFYPLDSVFYFIAADPFWALLAMLCIGLVFATIKETSLATAALATEVTSLAAQIRAARETETKLRSEIAQAIALRRRICAMANDSQIEGNAYAETADETMAKYREAVDQLVAEREELLSELAEWESTKALLTARQSKLVLEHSKVTTQLRNDAERAANALDECFVEHAADAMQLMARRDALLTENDELRAALAQMQEDTDTLAVESQSFERLRDGVSSTLVVETDEEEEPIAMDPQAIIEELTGECFSCVRQAASVGPTESEVPSPEPVVERQVLGNATNRPNPQGNAGKKPQHPNGKPHHQKAKPSSGAQKGGKRRHRKALVKLVGKEN